ncbi:MAG: cbb3-type cytochrome oxidase assembly protein CcoS [Anaeromyxobacter sp.]
MNLAGLILLSLGLGLGAWAFFMWTVKSGQYEDPEGAKYRMLEEDEGVPGPREGKQERKQEQEKLKQ